jgi:hypothetical protein
MGTCLKYTDRYDANALRVMQTHYTNMYKMAELYLSTELSVFLRSPP